MLYKCDKCNKVFNHKYHYLSHINRKFSCIKNDDHNDKTIIEKDNKLSKIYPKLSSPQNLDKVIYPNLSKVIHENENIYMNV